MIMTYGVIKLYGAYSIGFVEYTILFNGSPHEEQSKHTDHPLSSYLFVLCVEGLSTSLVDKEVYLEIKRSKTITMSKNIGRERT